MSSDTNDADVLYRILSTANTKERDIIEIVSNRKKENRIKIRSLFRARYKKDLIEEILNRSSKSYSSDLSNGLSLLFQSQNVTDAKDLNMALNGKSGNETKVMEILCLRNYQQILKIKETYTNYYLKDISESLKGVFTDDFIKVFDKLLTLKRNRVLQPDKKKCISYAQELINLSKDEWLYHDSPFLNIIATCSSREIILICKYYHRETGKTLLQTIANEFDGKFGKELKNMMFILCSPAEYLAKKLNDELINDTSNNSEVFNILISREDIDIKLIKMYYLQLFGIELDKDIFSLYKKDDKQYLLTYLKNY